MVATTIELVVENLIAGYDGMRVVDRLSLSLRGGQRTGVIGRNGAGKTTTLAAIMGLAEHQGGHLRLDGADITALPTFQRARRGLGYVPQTRDIFVSLTVAENLLAALNGRPESRIEVAYHLFPRLRERRDHLGGQLSGGEQQMLSIARALVPEPKILLLDEPLEGIAPRLAEEITEAISRLTEETGVGCLLIEQHVDVVLDFASSIIVLERGVPVFAGPTAELRTRQDILDRAIGLNKTEAAHPVVVQPQRSEPCS